MDVPRLIARAQERFARLERSHSTVAQGVTLLRHSIERVVTMQFVERSVALGSLAFTALVPLLVITAAFFPGTDGFGSSLIERFHLSGASAAAVRELFTAPDPVQQSVSYLGIAVLVGSALSFTRALQRVYEHAWSLDPRGWRGTRAGLIWITGIVVWATAFSSVREWVVGLTGPLVAVLLALAGNAVLWLWSPYMLLAGRVAWRRLLPTALLTAVAMTGLSVGSIVYMPEAITQSSERYGPIGIAIALVSWLIAGGFVLVVAAAVGAVISGEPGRAKDDAATADPGTL